MLLYPLCTTKHGCQFGLVDVNIVLGGATMDIIKIGNFIRECRKNKNLTQKQLADKLFIEPKTISKWETGNGLPDVSIIKNLCNELNISLSELFIGEYVKDESYELITEQILLNEFEKTLFSQWI